MFNLNISRKRMLITLVQLLAIAGLSIIGGRVIHSRLLAKQARVSGPIPYTVILRETSYGADGTATVTSETTEAIRSDGSRLFSRTPLHNPAEGVVRDLTLASGVEVIVNDLANLKSTVAPGFLKNRRLADMHRDPGSNCINSFDGKPYLAGPVKEVVEGEEIVAGYRTVRISSGAVTSWLALDYGCACVKDRIDFGKDKGYSEHNLVALYPGEPNAALFAVPEHVREVPPSERIMANWKGDCGPDCSERRNQQLRRMDDDYYRNRPAQ
ncbi:MAG TPA: hypothetical protein VNQ79_09780 [Blastocatellia bacterium]|nr:hypothetical protein [Blastocatellia bacterium]